MKNFEKNNSQFSEQELIRNYLADTLSREQELEVAKLYDKNADFRDALDGLESLSLEEYDELLSKADMAVDKKIAIPSQLENKPVLKPVVKELHPYRRMAIAASIVFLLLSGSYLALNKMQSATTKLYAQHFELKDYPDMITRGSGEELSTSEKLAISAYNAENYEVSIEHFEMLKNKYPENVKYGLFLGISYLNSNETELAIKTLKSTKYEGTSFCNDVNWYLGLAYLRAKDKANAKEVFKKLANVDCYYNEAATQILTKL